jgi:hypothetical protein
MACLLFFSLLRPLIYMIARDYMLTRQVVRFQGDPDRGIKPNLHDDYDGMWFAGTSMANAYVREHTSFAVPLRMTEWDAWAKWPIKRCTSDKPWSETNYCWVDDSAACDRAAEAQAAPTCASVTAETCRSTEAHYTNCPCACLDAAVCSGEPPVIDRASLTYFPDMPAPLYPPTAPSPPTAATAAPTGAPSQPTAQPTKLKISRASATHLLQRGAIIGLSAAALALLPL